MNRTKYKIMLVNPPAKGSQNSNYSCFPAVNIVQLATRVKKEYGPLVDVLVIDGGIEKREEIERQLKLYKPNLIGISALTLTYEEGLAIAKKAKELDVNTKVVLGNDHASLLAEKILKKREFIDYIITNDVGETPFSKLVGYLLGKNKLEDVDSLVYRSNDRVIRNSTKFYDLKETNTIPDIELIKDKLSIYSEHYMVTFGHLHTNPIIPMIVNNARGCKNFKRRCDYCAILDLSLRFGKIETFWKMVEKYSDEYGINLFFEVLDSFFSSPLYIDGLIEKMPESIKRKIEASKIEFMVYANATDLVKKENIQRLKKLGVKRVNIGLDGGDFDTLAQLKKDGADPYINLHALDNLKEADMTTHVSFIAGARGETTESLIRTVEFIKYIVNRYHKDKPFFSSIEFSRLIPLPNSNVWKSIESICHTSEIIDSDVIDIEKMAKIWFDKFTKITEGLALEKIKEVDNFLMANKIVTGKNVG
jgi:radical SAM superfamily enzyme YgiQ (UPF0313 family)